MPPPEGRPANPPGRPDPAPPPPNPPGRGAPPPPGPGRGEKLLGRAPEPAGPDGPAGRPRGIGPRPPIPGGGGIGRPVWDRIGAGGGGIALPLGLSGGPAGTFPVDAAPSVEGAVGVVASADEAPAAGTEVSIGAAGVLAAAGREGAELGIDGRGDGAGRVGGVAARSWRSCAPAASSLAGRLRTTRCSGRRPSVGRSASSGRGVDISGVAVGCAVARAVGFALAFEAGAGSSGCTARTRPSRSALRRTRSAWASSIDEEWLLTPIPSPIERSSASLFVSPSSFASS